MNHYSSLNDKTQFFTCYRIDDMKSLLSFLEYAKDKHFVYRGVKDSSFMNYSSAQVNTSASLNQQEFDLIIQDTIQIVRKSNRVMRMLRRKTNDSSDSEILALLQHYGFGTPFLDYSYIINYAIFFALDGMSEFEEHDDIVHGGDPRDYCSVYAFSWKNSNHIPVQLLYENSIDQLEECDRLGKETYGSQYKGLSDQTFSSYRLPYNEFKDRAQYGITIATRSGGSIVIDSPQTGLHVTYDITNDRDDIQRGLFKCNSSAQLPYEQVALNWYPEMNSHIICLDIHKSLKEQLVEQFLNPLNICSLTVYPKTSYSNKMIRELLKLPIDRRLRPRSIPKNMSIGTFFKYNHLYQKRLLKRLKNKI